MEKEIVLFLVCFFGGWTEANPSSRSGYATYQDHTDSEITTINSDGVIPPQPTTTVKSYEIFNLTLPWYEAQIFCRERNMNLATVRSQEENDFLIKMLQVEGLQCTGTSVWLGGTVLHSQRGYFWMSDSKPVVYSNWETNQPDDGNGQEKCLSTRYLQKWQWNDWPCEDLFPFACERTR